MKTRKINVILLLLLTIPIAGCNWTLSSNVQNNSPTPTGEMEQILVAPEEEVPQTTPTISSNANLQTLIEKARADLAQQMSIPASEINLVATLEVIWPDSSLGCPQPNVMYTQVLTDGFLIQLEVNGEVYQYHSDSGDQVVICENEEYPLIPIPPGEIHDGEPWVPVN